MEKDSAFVRYNISPSFSIRTLLAMQHVSAVGISQSPVNIECRVRKIEELGSHTMFIADVVGVTVDDKYMDGTGKFHINDTGLVMYSHGEYFGFGT